MPKRKTGQRKKAEKQKERQKAIQAGLKKWENIANLPSNAMMECDGCGRSQKNRAFCYFCSQTQKHYKCAQCGRVKCIWGTSDCLIKHPNSNATGMGIAGAICDFCEAVVCHSRRCIQTHACSCPLKEQEECAKCFECKRSVWEHGGRVFRCNHCDTWLCEDDHFEHESSCQKLESENYKCISCNKFGIYSCLQCKLCFCDDHVKGTLYKEKKGEGLPCKKCGFKLAETKDKSMSTRTHEFGRHAGGLSELPDWTSGGDAGYSGEYRYDDDYGAYGDYSDDDDYDDDDDEEEEEDEEEKKD